MYDVETACFYRTKWRGQTVLMYDVETIFFIELSKEAKPS